MRGLVWLNYCNIPVTVYDFDVNNIKGDTNILLYNLKNNLLQTNKEVKILISQKKLIWIEILYQIDTSRLLAKYHQFLINRFLTAIFMRFISKKFYKKRSIRFWYQNVKKLNARWKGKYNKLVSFQWICQRCQSLMKGCRPIFMGKTCWLVELYFRLVSNCEINSFFPETYFNDILLQVRLPVLLVYWWWYINFATIFLNESRILVLKQIFTEVTMHRSLFPSIGQNMTNFLLCQWNK